MIRVILAAGDFVARLETKAPYSPDVLDDLARQARLSLHTMLAQDDEAAEYEDVDLDDIDG